MVLAACSPAAAADKAEVLERPSRNPSVAEGESTLDLVRERGELICGTEDIVPGFAYVDEDGEFQGFYPDFCRVIAVAVLGDADAVRFEAPTTEQRFVVLQSGEVDVLVRGVTRTALRQGSEGAAFTTTLVYDGQGMMVKADSGIETLADMQNTEICVLSGSTSELNLASLFAAEGIAYEPVPFESSDELQPAFEAGRCDGWTVDKSELAAMRANWPEGPEAVRILEETMSKEPLGPAVRGGDQRWFNAVDWATIVTIQAEEFGITSENIDEFMETDDPEIARFLGLPDPEEGTVFDPGLNLEPDFAQQIIRQVGNYGEIWDRHLGPDTPIGLERGLNQLWTEGGLLYAPPYR